MYNFEPSLYNSYADLAHRQHRSRMYNPDVGGIIYIAAGMGYNPMDTAHKEFLDNKYKEIPGYSQEVYNTWLKHRDEAIAHIATLPSHAEFLAKTIYNTGK